MYICVCIYINENFYWIYRNRSFTQQKMSLPYLQMIGRSHERSIPTCMDHTHTHKYTRTHTHVCWTSIHTCIGISFDCTYIHRQFHRGGCSTSYDIVSMLFTIFPIQFRYLQWTTFLSDAWCCWQYWRCMIQNRLLERIFELEGWFDMQNNCIDKTLWKTLHRIHQKISSYLSLFQSLFM